VTKRKRGDVYKYITPNYYGLRDEEDGVLLGLEGTMAAKNLKKLKECREEHRELKKRKKDVASGDGTGDSSGDSSESSDEGLTWRMGLQSMPRCRPGRSWRKFVSPV